MTFGEDALVLLSVAAVVALMTRRLRLPYSVGLVLAGMALGALPFTLRIGLTRDLVFSTLLPPLIFDAAFHLRWKDLRAELPLVLTLASFGVAISGAVTAMGMHYVALWPWAAALVFGALIAATDPVAVIETFREAGSKGRLSLLIQSESLLNDGAAAVAFAVAVAWASGKGPTPLVVLGMLAAVVAGSLACGIAVAATTLFLVGRTEDHLVELTFTTVAAYGSFLLAEQLHASGVLAAITAGLIIGNRGPLGILSDRGRVAVDAFWAYAAFAASSIVFLLIGMRETSQHFAAIWEVALMAIAFVLLGRAASVYPICAIFARSPSRVTMRDQNALFWGGLRGALALALALGLPVDFPSRDEVITVSFAVVAFSIFVQGLSMPAILRGMAEAPAEAPPDSPPEVN
jgi:CPA1 family monovalent cation:H+ antiporter